MACDWEISYGVCSTDDEGVPLCFAKLTPEEISLVEQMAVDYLSLWTSHQFGLCDVTIRPCREDCEGGSTYWGRGMQGFTGGIYKPVLIGGSWYNIGCGCGQDSCSCTVVPQLKIPGPVHEITSVVIGGEALPTDSYRVDNYNLLVRTDGAHWPRCQDMTAPEGSEGSWEVHYVRGLPVPAGGQVAAGILACEYAKALCKDASCALPQRMKNITRQGVTVTIMDDFKDADEGRTGIYQIDSWLASVRRAPRRSTVMSPDYRAPRHRRTTWK